ncbi:MAG: hypothetical protein ISQ74_03465 [Puniceicoccaceae bacterium]|nr:hypothetical protein [Puniceicoccaceae bacterium]
MPHKTLFSCVLAAVLLSMFGGCGGSRSVRVIEGDEQIRSALTGSVYASDQAIIVHVNEFDRLATLRNARSFPKSTFLETSDSEGNKSAILKTRGNRPTGLGTADIVEGLPKINDRATPVNAAENVRLGKIYRDLDAE